MFRRATLRYLALILVERLLHSLNLSLFDWRAAWLMNVLMHIVQHNHAAFVAFHRSHNSRTLGLVMLVTLPKHQKIVFTVLVVAVLVDHQCLLAIC